MPRGRAPSLLLFCAAWQITNENDDDDDTAHSLNSATRAPAPCAEHEPQVASAPHFAGKDTEAVSEAVRG